MQIKKTATSLVDKSTVYAFRIDSVAKDDILSNTGRELVGLWIEVTV